MIPSFRNPIFAGAAALGMLTSTVIAAQYALVVGINDYPGTQNDLTGCMKDVQDVSAFLGSQGFPQENIVVLRDAQATIAGIEGAFKSHLIAKAKPGDSVVFFFSGHGTQVPDLDGDEDDDADECICNYDINPRNPASWMTDDRLRVLISQIQTDRILVMLDCCHSGTGTRGFSGQSPVPGAKYMHLGFDRPERVTRNFSIKQTMRSPGTLKGHTLLAACAASEVARDGGAAKGGLFTALFLEEVKQNPGSPMKSAVEKANAKVAEIIKRSSSPGDSQTPQLEGAGDASIAEFLGGKPGSGITQALATATPPSAPSGSAGPNTTATPSANTSTTAAGPQSAFPLTLSARQDYQNGEFMTCSITSAKDGYLRLYYTDSEQKTYMIFPNKLRQDNKIRGGSPVQVPGTTDGFKLKVFYPKHLQGAAATTAAQEILTAVVSPTPFKDQSGDKWLGESTFMEFNNQSRRKVITRGIEVVKNEAAIAHFIYTVHPSKN